RPCVRRGADEGGAHVYEVYGVADASAVTAGVDQGRVRVEWAAPGRPPAGGASGSAPSDPEAPASGLPAHARVSVEGEQGSDVTAYTLTLEGAVRREFTGLMVRAEWYVTFFHSAVDPREDAEAWREKAFGMGMIERFYAQLSFRF